MKKLPHSLEDHRILIRQLRLADAPPFHTLINDKDIIRWTIEIPHPYPLRLVQHYIRSSQTRWRQATEYNFAVVLKKTDQFLGEVRLLNIDHHDKHALLAYWLGKPYWRKGYKTEAARLALRFAFDHLNLHRVEAYIFDKNTGSRRVLEKCGLREEGRLRHWWRRENTWHDKVFFGILEPEYRRLNPQNP